MSRIILSLMFSMVVFCANAQGDTGDDPDFPDVPLDGGLTILLAAGTAYGLRKAIKGEKLEKDK